MSSPTPEQPDGSFSPTPIQQPVAKTSIPDAAYSYALDSLLKGHAAAEVRTSLRDAGYNEEQVEDILKYALDTRNARNARSRPTAAPGGGSGGAGNTNMLVGGAVCLLGLVVTIGSLAASSRGGGAIIAWGAIVFGGIQFFRGVMQNSNASSDN